MMNPDVQDILKKTSKLVPRYGDTYSDAWLVYEIINLVKDNFPDVEPRSDIIFGSNTLESMSPDILSSGSIKFKDGTHIGGFRFSLGYIICACLLKPMSHLKQLLKMGVNPIKIYRPTFVPTFKVLKHIYGESEKVDFLKLLVEYGFDIEIAINDIYREIADDNDYMFDYMISCKNSYFYECNPLMEACKRQKSECVKILIKSGVNVNMKDKHNLSALDYVFYSKDNQPKNIRNRIECIKLLLDAGAKYN